MKDEGQNNNPLTVKVAYYIIVVYIENLNDK